MSANDLGKLILRASLGVLMLLHGVHKLRHGIDGVVGAVEGVGLPGVIGYGVYVGEVLAPLLIIVGYMTRPAAAVFALNMAVAVALAHTGDLAKLTGGGGWGTELQGLYFFGAVAVALLGAGRYSLSRGHGRFN